MSDLKKTYYGGYKPKPTNVVKLEAYVKNTTIGASLNDNSRLTNPRAQRDKLKNKRIK